MRTSYVLLLLFLATGIAAIAGGTLGILETRAFLADAISAQGVVISVERYSFDPVRRIGELWSAPPWRVSVPTFEFAGRDGRVHRVTGHQGGSEVGEKVAVLYSPRDPNHAVIDSARALWGGSVALLGVGLLFTAGCVFALIGPTRAKPAETSLFR